MLDSIQCPHCSASNHGAARFCNNCGGLLVQPGATGSAAPPNKRSLVRWPFAIAGALALLFVAVAIVAGSSSSEDPFLKMNREMEAAEKRAVANGLEKYRASLPVMGWIADHSESKAFAPGQYVYGFQVQTQSLPAKVRVDMGITYLTT